MNKRKKINSDEINFDENEFEKNERIEIIMMIEQEYKTTKDN